MTTTNELRAESNGIALLMLLVGCWMLWGAAVALIVCAGVILVFNVIVR